MIHWVIGNGESRADINIDNLSGVKYGCNAIYRDYWTDFLFAKDKGISQEIISSESWRDRRVYFQHRWSNNSDVREAYNHIMFWDKDFQDCGTMALRTASENAIKYLNDTKYPDGAEVHMIGFDYDKTNKPNNIYKGSNNYPLKRKPRYGVTKEFLETFNLFPQLQYVHYNIFTDRLNEYNNVKVVK